MKKERLEKLSTKQLINLIIGKDELINHLQDMMLNTKFIGRVLINGKYYSAYIKEEN